MKRRIFNLLAAVSLVLAVIVTIGWIRGFFTVDVFRRDSPDSPRYLVYSGGGLLFVTAIEMVEDNRGREPPASYRGSTTARFEWRTVSEDELWLIMPIHDIHPQHRFNFWRRLDLFGRMRHGERTLSSGFAVPYWSLCAITLILPALRVTKLVSERRRAIVGHCHVCNYDLRATPERCPECGTLANKPETVKT